MTRRRVTASLAARAALDATAGGAPVAIATLVHRDDTIERIILYENGACMGELTAEDAAAVELAWAALQKGAPDPLVRTDGDTFIFVELYRAREQLIIVGAGHIAVPLARLGVLLDFSVTVLDDREEFATGDRFDQAVTVVRSDFATDPFAGVTIDDNSYVALVTRGHRWDFDCLQRLIALDVRPRYIGMIGSRRRVRAAFHALLAAGVPRATLAGIRAPIGIEIRAETPAEIAVAIAAELVAVRRGADTDSLTARERVLERFLKEDT